MMYSQKFQQVLSKILYSKTKIISHKYNQNIKWHSTIQSDSTNDIRLSTIRNQRPRFNLIYRNSFNIYKRVIDNKSQLRDT